MTTLVLVCVGIYAFLLVLWLVGKLVLGKNSRTLKLRPGFLCLVVGHRRHGKSLFVCRLIADRVAAGVPVYANFHVEGAQFIREWRDVILAPRNSFVVLDEVSGWAGARSGSTLRPAASWYVAQCGKLDHECYIIAQSERQVAGIVVDLVNEFILCKKLMNGRHVAHAFAIDEFRKRGAKPLWSWHYTVKGEAAKTYGTRDLIPPEPSRRNTWDEDVNMIVECIDIIQLRDRQIIEQTAQLDGWLASAGVGGGQ